MRRQAHRKLAGVAAIVLQVHARVVVDIGLGDGEEGHAREFGKQRQTNHRVRMDAAQRHGAVVVLPGTAESAQDQRVGGGVLREDELRVLVGEAQFLDGVLLGHQVAERGAVVIDSRFDAEMAIGFFGLAQFECRGVAQVVDFLRFTGWQGVGLVDLAGLHGYDLDIRSQYRLALDLKPQGGRRHHRLATISDLVGETAVRLEEGHAEGTVRRRNLRCRQPAETGHTNQKSQWTRRHFMLLTPKFLLHSSAVHRRDQAALPNVTAWQPTSRARACRARLHWVWRVRPLRVRRHDPVRRSTPPVPAMPHIPCTEISPQCGNFRQGVSRPTITGSPS